MPKVNEFVPVGQNGEEKIILTVDEYEVIRLIDKEGFTQKQCGEYMNIARTTVQLIYDRARKKIAVALTEALPLAIEGGDYRLCEGNEHHCDCGGCQKHNR